MINWRFKFLPQHDKMDCGPACLQMIARYYGKKYSLQYIRKHSTIARDGISVLGINQTAQFLGFDCFPVQINRQMLDEGAELPCILHWNQNHFVVLYQKKTNFWTGKSIYKIADPGHGLVDLEEEEFEQQWFGKGTDGIAMMLYPSDAFYAKKVIKEKKFNFKFLLNYLKPYRWNLTQLLIGLLGGSLITLIFPFLTQMLIDDGIKGRSTDVLLIIIMAQFFLFLGSSVIEIIRNWITLFIGSHINIKIISDFLGKLMKLPVQFFDTKLMGDFNQRINDQERVEKFLTSKSLLTLFSLINFSVFFIVLGIYDLTILAAFSVLTLVAIVWILVFQRQRRMLDYIRFQSKALNQDAIFEMISGMQEIKLNNFEEYKRNQWEDIQIKLFNISVQILKLDQYQGIGYSFINHAKNILVTYIAARAVISGQITLGAMLSISYIIGQMNGPLNQLIDFIRSFQDARISMDRLTEIQQQEEEERPEQMIFTRQSDNGIKLYRGLRLQNLDFSYNGAFDKKVLANINVAIPEGKTTAIVGASGSGKTTLMKLLLKFYEPNQGEILVDHYDLANLKAGNWRQHCGVVMQDGFIFSDTLERNIATCDEEIDEPRLYAAIRQANLGDFVEGLPLGVKTLLGAAGNGISGGQKQRLLIARAIYKNPQYLFFDEATSALDAENEKVIMGNLQAFLKGKTAVVIAHRLSTVKNADQIIVLHQGQIVEQGSHEELVHQRQHYFHLVKNQLELGN